MSNSKTTPAPDLAVQIKTAIQGSGLSNYKIAKVSGFPQPVLQRFISGQPADIRLDTVAS